MALIRFGTSRQLLVGFFAIVHFISLGLALFLHPCFVSPNGIWILSTLEAIILALFLTSALTKLVFKRRYTVVQEVCNSVAAFAFSAVLCLFGVTASVNSDVVEQLHAKPIISAWTHILVISMFSQFGYAAILVALAMLTNVTFDRNVWFRDIDASPSPFPVAIIASYLLPCLIPRPNLAPLPFPSGPADPSSADRPICHKNGFCDQCPSKPDSLQIFDPQSQVTPDASKATTNAVNDLPATSEMPTSDTRLSKLSRASRKSSISISQSLVQVPNAAQRRLSIPITLDVLPDEVEEV